MRHYLLPGICWLGLACLASIVDGQQSTVQESHAKALDKITAELESVCKTANIPGASLAIWFDDGTRLLATAGTDASPDAEPVTSDQRFFAGSIGKTYFAAMAFDLMQQGKLSPDDKVEKYLADVPWYSQIANSSEIKVIHLMRHESGIPRYVLARELWQELNDNPDRAWAPGEQLKFILDEKPLHAPGDGWAYSDSNYILLGMILEKISGETCYDYIQRRFLEPHQLKNTIPTNQRELENLCEGRSLMFRGFGLPERIAPDGTFAVNPQFEWCGGGYMTTPDDLARWAQLLYTGQVVEGDYVQQMHDLAVAAPELGGDTKYGPGAMIRGSQLGESLGHDGVMPGYQASMAYWPKHKVAAALQVNTDATRRLGMSLDDLLAKLVAMAIIEE